MTLLLFRINLFPISAYQINVPDYGLPPIQIQPHFNLARKFLKSGNFLLFF